MSGYARDQCYCVDAVANWVPSWSAPAARGQRRRCAAQSASAYRGCLQLAAGAQGLRCLCWTGGLAKMSKSQSQTLGHGPSSLPLGARVTSHIRRPSREAGCVLQLCRLQVYSTCLFPRKAGRGVTRQQPRDMNEIVVSLFINGHRRGSVGVCCVLYPDR